MNILRTVKDFFHYQREIRQMKRTLISAKFLIEDLREENDKLKEEIIALKLGVMQKICKN
jgi:hypothetical protein